MVDRPEQSLAHISPTLQSACQARWVDSRQALESKSAGCIYRLPMALRDESSTIARAGIADGFDMGGLLPNAVAEYIKIHHLYASGV